MQRIDRKQEGVDRHVVEALHLGLEALAERAIGVGEDVQLARAVALDLLERQFERQRADVDAIELAQALVGEIDSGDGVVDRADEYVHDLGVGVHDAVVELRLVQAEVRRLGYDAQLRSRKLGFERLLHGRKLARGIAFGRVLRRSGKAA